MSDFEIQLRRSNIYHIALERIKSIVEKKQETLQKKKKKNIKYFLKVKQVFSLLKNLHVI